MDDDIKEYWLFWRIVILGEESYDTVDGLTAKELLEYNTVLDIKDAIQQIMQDSLQKGTKNE